MQVFNSEDERTARCSFEHEPLQGLKSLALDQLRCQRYRDTALCLSSQKAEQIGHCGGNIGAKGLGASQNFCLNIGIRITRDNLEILFEEFLHCCVLPFLTPM